MSDDIKYPINPRNGKALAGIVLLVVGALLLLQQFKLFFIPPDIVLWPLWLIFWGLFIAARSNFRKPSSFILIVIGVVLLVAKNFDGADGFIWPMAIIAFGLWMILRRRTHFDKDSWTGTNNKWHHYNPVSGTKAGEPLSDTTYTEVPPAGPSPFSQSGRSGNSPTGDDYIDAVSVFGSVKKTILSKDFKGGEIVNIFGGAELDFTQSDINGRVIIDITQIFGGVKMIVPPHWQVVPDIAAVFAGIEDKRMKSTAAPGSDKILVLKGVSIFAGVDIRSF